MRLKGRTAVACVFAAALAGASRDAAADDTGFARVHIDSDGPVTLVRKTGDGWATACLSPCNQYLAVGRDYRISGATIAPSSEFRIRPESDHHAHLFVARSSKTGFVAGGAMAIAGGAGVIGSALLTIVGAVWAGQRCSAVAADARVHCDDLRDEGATMRSAGLVSLGVAAAVGVSGVVLLLRGMRTDVTQRPERASVVPLRGAF